MALSNGQKVLLLALATAGASVLVWRLDAPHAPRAAARSESGKKAIAYLRGAALYLPTPLPVPTVYPGAVG